MKPIHEIPNLTDANPNMDNRLQSMKIVKEKLHNINQMIMETQRDKWDYKQLQYFVAIVTSVDDYNRIINILEDVDDMAQVNTLNQALRQLENYIETSLLYFERLLK